MTDEHPPDDDSIDQTNSVQRTDHGVSITTEIKRGTGTRDQDKHVIKSKGGSFSEARYYHEQALDYLDGGGGDERPPLERVRDWDPEREPGGDDA